MQRPGLALLALAACVALRPSEAGKGSCRSTGLVLGARVRCPRGRTAAPGLTGGRGESRRRGQVPAVPSRGGTGSRWRVPVAPWPRKSSRHAMVPRPHLPLRVLLHLGRLLAYVLSVRRTHHTPARKTPPDLSSGAKQVAQEQTRGKRRAMGSSSTRAPASPRCRLPALSAPSGARARVPTSAPTHPLPHGRHGYRHVSATTVKRRDVVLLSFCLVSFPDFVSLAILPIASSCCTEVSHHISRRLLERVNICRIQKADGDCDLAAVILHVKRRRICVSPHNHVMKRWMKEQAAKKNAKGSICHKRQHHSKGSSKGAQQEKQKVHGHKTPY